VRYPSIVRFVRSLAKKMLPDQAIEWYRRRRALRHYLRSLSYQVYDRGDKMEIEELEGTILAKRPELTERLTKDVLERTDLILQELDRQIEGVRARHGNELRSLRDEVDELRASLVELAEQLQGERKKVRPEPAGSRAAASSAPD
jgi:hypothetical protein